MVGAGKIVFSTANFYLNRTALKPEVTHSVPNLYIFGWDKSLTSKDNSTHRAHLKAKNRTTYPCLPYYLHYNYILLLSRVFGLASLCSFIRVLQVSNENIHTVKTFQQTGSSGHYHL